MARSPIGALRAIWWASATALDPLAGFPHQADLQRASALNSSHSMRWYIALPQPVPGA